MVKSFSFLTAVFNLSLFFPLFENWRVGSTLYTSTYTICN